MTRGHDRRVARREKRRAARTSQMQYYGGSKDQLATDRANAADDRSTANTERLAATKRLSDSYDKADSREGAASGVYAQARSDTGVSRAAQETAIGGIGSAATTAIGMRNNAASAAMGQRNMGAQTAIGMRNQALQANDLNKIAANNILENNQNSQNILGRNIGIQNRAAMGLATGGGEGGALALQNAIAGASQGGADMAGAAQLQQNQLATDTRNAAAQQQVANALNIAGVNAGTVTDTSNLNAGTITGTGDANAGTTTDAATNIAAQTAALRNADQATTDAASARQLNFLGQKNALAGGTSDAALTNQGQQIGYQQGIDTTQLGVDQANEAARLASNKRNSLLGKINIVTQGTTGGLLGK